MESILNIKQKYIGIPIKVEQPLKTIEIYNADKKIFEFRIPIASNKDKEYEYDYLSYINVLQYQNCDLTIKGDYSKSWIASIVQKTEYQYNTLDRPLIHFTADRGWINDPNGLVYHNGIYHLYFQYNSFNTQWENMSWGHAISKDLIHWNQIDTVMWPDEDGTIFSGSAIINEKGLLGLDKEDIIYFYTTAGDTNLWSSGKSFTQKTAYSKDGGKTVIKSDLGTLDTICKENRDPKVFYHDESKSYIMVIWLEKNEFAILRSGNLKNWKLSQRLILEKAWECPDLIELNSDIGDKKWIFWSADGFYFIGSFDGYKFVRETERLLAYKTNLPYAAQTYSGVKGRTITVPWLRTVHKNSLFTGSMGIPRELTLVDTSMGKRLKMKTISEYESLKKNIYSCTNYNKVDEILFTNDRDCPFEINIEFLEDYITNKLEITLLRENLIIDFETKSFIYNGEVFELNQEIKQISIIFDKGIIETTCNYDIIYLVFETDIYNLEGNVNFSTKNIKNINIYQIY